MRGACIYGFADGESNLIGYVSLADDHDARVYARKWLDAHPAHDCVECWRDTADQPPSFVVRRQPVKPLTNAGGDPIF